MGDKSEREAQLKEAFDVFDHDRSAYISWMELATVLKAMGHKFEDDAIKDLVSAYDVDNNGEISFDEFVQMMSDNSDTPNRLSEISLKLQEPIDEIKEAFQVFDNDGDGLITAAELQEVLNRLGENIQISDCELMISSVDTDSDATISLTEFRKMMTDGPT